MTDNKIPREYKKEVAKARKNIDRKSYQARLEEERAFKEDPVSVLKKQMLATKDDDERQRLRDMVEGLEQAAEHIQMINSQRQSEIERLAALAGPPWYKRVLWSLEPIAHFLLGPLRFVYNKLWVILIVLASLGVTAGMFSSYMVDNYTASIAGSLAFLAVITCFLFRRSFRKLSPTVATCSLALSIGISSSGYILTAAPLHGYAGVITRNGALARIIDGDRSKNRVCLLNGEQVEWKDIVDERHRHAHDLTDNNDDAHKAVFWYQHSFSPSFMGSELNVTIDIEREPWRGAFDLLPAHNFKTEVFDKQMDEDVASVITSVIQPNDDLVQRLAKANKDVEDFEAGAIKDSLESLEKARTANNLSEEADIALRIAPEYAKLTQLREERDQVQQEVNDMSKKREAFAQILRNKIFQVRNDFFSIKNVTVTIRDRKP